MRILAAIGLLAIIVAVGGAVYLFGGYYDVAASTSDGSIIDSALERIRDASISRHATEQPPFSLDNADVVRAGARQFSERGCVDCHGAPGVPRQAFVNGMNPKPPQLHDAANDPPALTFWTVKHGIRMTAMPSFGKVGVKDDEIWRIVAYIKKFPTITPEQFKAWTTTPPSGTPPANPSPPPGAPPADQAH